MAGASVGEWIEIPNTALSSVAPANDSRYGFVGAQAKIGAWNGATLRRLGSVYMLGAAGGHGDYAGNEVNAIALNTDAPQWVERKARSAIEDVIKNASVYLDNTRAAIHTYCSTQYDQANDRMVIVSGSGLHGTWTTLVTATPSDWPWLTSYADSPPSPILNPMMAFDYTTNQWLAPDALPLLPANVGGSDSLCCSNPDGTEVYAAAQGWNSIQRYTFATEAWEVVGSAGYIDRPGSAMDPTRGQILLAGNFNGTTDPRIFDIAEGENLSVSWGGLGGSALRSSAYPGVIYDEENDRYVVAINSGGVIEVFTVDPDTHVIAAMSVTGTKPAARPQGIHNSLQYVPELKGMVIANSYTGNLKFMRLA